MDFFPPRRLGLLLGVGLLLLLLGLSAWGIARLGSAPVAPLTVLWVLLPLLGLPLAAGVGYRLYGLLTAQYRIDRDGFYLRWGSGSEQIPIGMVRGLRSGSQWTGRLWPAPGLWWPGCVVGRGVLGSQGEVEFFVSAGREHLLFVETGGRTLAITPQDPQGFIQAFVNATRLGSLEPIRAVSVRPDFLLVRVGEDRRARLLILIGLALPLFLLAFLAFRAPSLPELIPFGFAEDGSVGTLAPPGRLLLLPILGGFFWLVDLLLGAWAFRKPGGRLPAYGLWGVQVLLGLLLWGAVLQLLLAA
jgi:hypothetical protein